MEGRIRKASESRGFAVSRVLTHWPEIVGEAVAAIATPVNVSYGRHGMGATLIVLTNGANAPMLEMQKDRLRDKVNACYGYRAIARVKITQTAPTGFAEGKAQFAAAPKIETKPSPQAAATAAALAEDVTNPELRDVLAQLGAKVLSRTKPT